MNEIDKNAKIIWDYMHMGHDLRKCDAIFVLGSRDDRVAEYAAELYKKGYGKYIIISGGSAHHNDLLETKWTDKTEAEHFAKIAQNAGVPESALILEKKATNTGENIQFVYQILQEKKLNPVAFLLVQKPYMERRAYATFAKQWPGNDVEIIVTSPRITYDEYFDKDQPKEDIINIMVGDLERIIKYPEKGFQIEQIVQDDVMTAFKYLIAQGYKKHLIKG